MKIVIPGNPIAQARMRHFSRGKFVQVYDPVAKEKKAIRHVFLPHEIRDHFKYPRVTFLFCMPIPKSILKRDIELYNSGRLKHIKKPDADNLAKLFLDCADGIVLCGDQKVSLGPCVKVYDPEPKTIMWIHETTCLLQDWELDVEYLSSEEHALPCFYECDYPYGSCDLWTQVHGLFLRSCDPDYVA